MSGPRPGRRFTPDEEEYLQSVISKFPPVTAEQGARLRQIFGPASTWPTKAKAASCANS